MLTLLVGSKQSVLSSYRNMELSSRKIFSIATMLFASLLIEVIAEERRLEQLNVVNGASAAVQQRDKRYVLFPQFTVLQVRNCEMVIKADQKLFWYSFFYNCNSVISLQFTMAIVIPMEVPQRKIAMNVGLQCNFNLPYAAKEFYKPPFWDTRSLDKEGPASSGNGTSRGSRSLLPVRADSCRETQANLLSFDDFSAEDFYAMVQNYMTK